MGDWQSGELNSIAVSWNAQQAAAWQGLVATSVTKLIRVTAVLMADNDGGRALGKRVGSQIRPVDPWLRDRVRHSEKQSFIDDWIALANAQLAKSKATFLLDHANVQYVLAHNTAANSLECSAPDHSPILNLIARQQAASATGNPWRDSLLLVFRWGMDPKKPTEQGCSSATSPHILMPGNFWRYYETPRFVDGKPIPGNNILTHELGHFLGLPHVFPGDLANYIGGIGIYDQSVNPLGLPLTEANLPKLPGWTAAGIAAARKKLTHAVATWMYALDSDAPWISDTQADLSMGLPAIMGDPVGSGTHEYEFARYTQLNPDPARPGFGIPAPGSGVNKELVTVDQSVRLNVMSYWYSDVYGQRFSKSQVDRMTELLKTSRAHITRPVAYALPPLDKHKPAPVDPASFRISKPRVAPQVAAKAGEELMQALVGGKPLPREWLTPKRGNACGIGRD